MPAGGLLRNKVYYTAELQAVLLVCYVAPVEFTKQTTSEQQLVTVTTILICTEN